MSSIDVVDASESSVDVLGTRLRADPHIRNHTLSIKFESESGS
jgi:hypothetical protein